jgi:hypothetical protein
LTAEPLPDFVPVSLTAEPKMSNSAVEIALGGAVIRVAPGVDLAFLSDVLRVVRAQG